ncbi:hypothetical protein MD484_g6330, partial [Candolleomyces efflorescens]
MPSPDENLVGSEKAKLVMPDLAGAIALEDNTFARAVYQSLASDASIDAFLKKSRSYSLKERRWKLPRNCTRLFNGDFYTPVRNIVSSIMKHFWKDAMTQGTRQVVDTHTTDLQHSRSDPESHKSRPSLVIKAAGSSFQTPLPKTGETVKAVGFSNAASCIEIRCEGDDFPVEEQLVRATIYARQIFIHQPNRRYVRILVLSGHHLRVFHFDRSGVQYTPPLDIHEEPHTFVRLILGLSSPNESDIGLDATIFWLIKNGRKIVGGISMRGADDNETLYQLSRLEPLFCRTNICGRSTTCWSVLDGDTGEELLVKSSWRSADRTSEHIYLRDAVGIPGVVQMVFCEPDRCQTLWYRGRSLAPAGFQNRLETRVLIKHYGSPITGFTSPKQVLWALRDAIAGHRALVKKGTLHRDVSIQNVLLGKPGAEPGDRGILIDFDIAIRYGADGIYPSADVQIGTRMYQSVMVLSTDEVPYPLPHTHLDDIESFFYVLANIIYTFDHRGISQPLGYELTVWNKYGHDAGCLGQLKRGFLLDDPLHNSISSRWPKEFLEVFYAFRSFLRPIAHQKMVFTFHDAESRASDWQKLIQSLDDHYDFVLRLFDEGIAALERAETELVGVTESVPPPTQTLPQTPRAPKRSREEEEECDSQLPQKRPKTPRPVRNS